VNRRSFLKTGAGATALLQSHPAWCAENHDSKLPYKEILAHQILILPRFLRLFASSLLILSPWTCFLLGSAAGSFAAETATIETPFFRFTLSATDGRCEILDKEAQVTWRAGTNVTRFGVVTLNSHEQSRRIDLTRCDVHSFGNELEASFQPFVAAPMTRFHVYARALPDQRTLELSYQEDDELEIESVSMLEDVLGVTDSERGYAVVPVREGLLVPADSGLNFSHHFDTYAYEGCHLAMLGVVQNGAAAFLTWSDPYVTAGLKSVVRKGDPNDLPVAGGRQRISPSLLLTGPARSFCVRFLGKGDYVTIAKAYRQVAQDKGWLVTWEQKLKTNPARAKLFGAANIKLWSALDRRMNAESSKEESVRVNWTFDEAAQVAEHLKRDLKLDRVLFTLGGWIHRGYDNQHPDILPTAPECGGDKALTDCARRVMKLGYLFCLHDNYQDIYRDSPSWNENLIMKTDQGKLARGGRWAGGQAYLTCSPMALELAKRPQNLRAVKKLTAANAYFIDTTYAAGLQECHDLAHPLTRSDDMKWKQALSDYARGVFGVFGSECGREWAIPHSDFFEGLTGVSGRYYHDANLVNNLGATVIPFFDLVYRDCIAMYGKYGYDPERAADYVLYHISLGRPLNYHSIPAHLYWTRPPNKPATANDEALFIRADNGWAADLHPLDRFIKNTYEILSPLNELTAQMQMSRHEFLTTDRKAQRTVFGVGRDSVEVTVNAGTAPYTCPSKLGGQVVLPHHGFLVESPTFVAFYAAGWRGLNYAEPPLFTLRSLDKQPIAGSRRVRVYHGFGAKQIKVGPTMREVEREAIINLPGEGGRK
jgi:hypothetical protein